MLALGYACSLNDVFVRFPYEKYKSLMKKFKTKVERRRKVKQVFRECVKLVVNDVIENNVTFKIQGISQLAGEIHMEPFIGEEFKRLRRLGKFKKVDFLESVFTGYQLFLYTKGKRDNLFKARKTPIYLNTAYTNRITKHTNEHKQYC